jgi:secreted Zn-dependent insulinase-like peptidase
MNKSPYDTNEYKSFVLDNGLRVLLVHDACATKSGASLAVSVGSYDETVPGTAHFLEHLLFMGSEKYPIENTYSAFINDHGGDQNAYTADTYTNYLFDVNSENFVDALDIFSQMFISPLLGESAVERELNAVNSEFTNYCNNDGWRSQEVTKCLANPNHPYSRFSVGNATSLNIPNIVDHVRELYKSKYSANLMNLCLVSNLDFDTLEPRVREMFEQIPNKNYMMNKSYPPFFTNLQKTISIVPIKNQHRMNVTWQVQKCLTELEEY